MICHLWLSLYAIKNRPARLQNCFGSGSVASLSLLIQWNIGGPLSELACAVFMSVSQQTDSTLLWWLIIFTSSKQVNICWANGPVQRSKDTASVSPVLTWHTGLCASNFIHTYGSLVCALLLVFKSEIHDLIYLQSSVFISADENSYFFSPFVFDSSKKSHMWFRDKTQKCIQSQISATFHFHTLILFPYIVSPHSSGWSGGRIYCIGVEITMFWNWPDNNWRLLTFFPWQ